MPPPIFVLTEQMDMPHGTEMLAALMLVELARRGHPVHLFTSRFHPRRSVWRDLLHELCVPVTHPGFWFLTRHHLPHRACALLMRRAARALRPALVIATDNDPLCCEALRLWRDEPVPFFVHDPSEASPACPHYDRAWFGVCNRVAGLSVHGERQARSAREYYGLTCPVRVVWPSCLPPGSSTLPPSPSREGVVRFGLFGRLVALKGASFALGALNRVLKAGARAELHLFGDGPHRAVLADLAESLSLAPHVHFHGAYGPADLDRLVQRVDVGLMPSIYEGFGLVMLELMARGRPVIASDVGSSREVLEGLGGGTVVERADTASLADAMLRYCNDRQLIWRDGELARAVWHRHFTPGHMIDRFIRFWNLAGASLAA